MNSRHVHLTFLFALAILGFYVVGYFVPSSLTWGFHALAFLPNLSLVYLAKNDPDSAIMCSLKAIELDSSYALGYKNLASAYAAKGDLHKAVSSLQKAIHCNPGYTRAYEEIAEVYFALRQLNEAMENYQRAAQLGSIGAQKFLRENGYSW